MDVALTVDAEALLRALDVAPERTLRHMRRGLIDAVALVQRIARQQHRFQAHTGALERSVSSRILDDTTAEVFLNQNVAPYGPYVHEGTRAHLIAPHHRKALRWPDLRDSWRYAKRVHHPGTKADQFLYTAATSSRDKLTAIFTRQTVRALVEAGLPIA